MGDQTGDIVEGQLRHVSKAEFDRVLGLQVPPESRVALFATLARINTLYMVARAGSGHLGSSFSSMEVVSWLHLEVMRRGGEAPDLYFSSKGHDAPGLYSVMMALGVLDFDLLHKLRRKDGLPGHPDVSTPGIVANTGSLGMGISKAKGIVTADRLHGIKRRVYVVTGDGELQEGQIWESLGSAANRGLGEITVIVDHNKLQSDTLVSRTSDLGDLAAKFAAFGWHVARCDGHDLAALGRTLEGLEGVTNRPKVLIADTVKGCGVSFMAHTAMAEDQEFYRFHSGAPARPDYHRALDELVDTANRLLADLRQPPLETVIVESAPATPPTDVQKLIPAYAQALVDLGARRSDVVALDADLMLDTGVLAFRDRFPGRFLQCGIAEMDMVSQAGGLALAGMLPVVHSFACFLSSRPNEHIYNNATERTKVVYVGSLAGVLPAGPGHSHQAVRDIASLTAVPGLVMIEPSCEAEVDMAVRWASDETASSVYLRLVSIPCAVNYALPQGYRLTEGRGVALRPGGDVVLVSYGPVMLPQAMEASRLLAGQGIAAKVINLPWLNRLDRAWLKAELAGARLLTTIDNHYLDGGQGSMVAAAAAEDGWAVPMIRLGLTDIPHCGQNAEVLAAHGLDGGGIAGAVTRRLASS